MFKNKTGEHEVNIKSKIRHHEETCSGLGND